MLLLLWFVDARLSNGGGEIDGWRKRKGERERKGRERRDQNHEMQLFVVEGFFSDCSFDLKESPQIIDLPKTHRHEDESLKKGPPKHSRICALSGIAMNSFACSEIRLFLLNLTESLIESNDGAFDGVELFSLCEIGIEHVADGDFERDGFGCECGHLVGEAELVLACVVGNKSELALALTLHRMDQCISGCINMEIDIKESTCRDLILNHHFDTRFLDHIKETLLLVRLHFERQCLNSAQLRTEQQQQHCCK